MTTAFTFTFAADDSGDQGFSFRCVLPVTVAGQGQVRASFTSFSHTFTCDHCSIGVWDGSTSRVGNCTAAPVELKFGGVSGFTVTAGTVVSDWVTLPFLVTDRLVVIYDVNVTVGAGAPGLGAPGAVANLDTMQSPTAMATWNVQAPNTLGDWSDIQRPIGVSLVETQGSGANFTAAALTVASPVLGGPALGSFVPLVLGAASIDGGLLGVHNLADKLYVCSQPPADFVSASVTYALGVKNFGVGNVFGAPAAGSPTGRKITSATVTDGTVTANGTVMCWAVVDSVNSNLLASGPLTGAAGVASGQVWTLGSFAIHFPSA